MKESFQFMAVRILPALVSLALATRGTAESATVTVQVDRPGGRVSPTLWGIFFEDINCSVDGGIYAEMVRNRSLEDTDRPDHWSLFTTGTGQGEMAVSLEHPEGSGGRTNWNRHSLQLRVSEASPENRVGVANAGYWGMALTQGAVYELSFSARCADGFQGPVNVELQKADGAVCARAQATGLTGQWRQFKLALTPEATESKGRLVLSVASRGTVWFDMVSLFPRETWKGRGLRPDLMEKLSGLKPSFVRFPGGCWVEGDTMAYAYRW
jgi:hypothetical protein